MMPKNVFFVLLGLFSVQSFAVPGEDVSSTDGRLLTLHLALSTAIANDPWLLGSRHSENAVAELGVAAGTLPDPRITVGFANLPTDTFDFDQEAMSQFKVGLVQMFPRGDSRQLQQKQLQVLSEKFPLERQDRVARVRVIVSELWLDTFHANATRVLIELNRVLFEQLVDVATLSYSAAMGNSRQQDIIRAQLELTRIEDRLLVLQQRFDMGSEQLGEWLTEQPAQQGIRLRFPLELPDLLSESSPVGAQDKGALELLSPERLIRHPAILALEQQVESANTGIALAKQKYKPEWGVSASYGYREDDPMGGDRSDFFSLGVSFDLPVFTANKQDREVRSAISKTEAIRTKKWLLLRKMAADMNTTKAKLQRLELRQELYDKQLLPQVRDQADASLAAYTNDDGDFAEVVRARIAQLNTEIEALTISVERQKSIARLNYYLAMGQTNEI